jgi:hypothetical protein
MRITSRATGRRSLVRASALMTGAMAVSLALAACGTSTTTPAADGTSSAPVTATGPAVDLAGVCPSTVVVQTDWNPEADHGALYQMLGPDPTINSNQKSVTSDLYANGQPTGVKLQIRAGGPAIGYSSVSAEMYQDKSITLGYVSTDEAIEYSGTLPTTAVFAETNTSAMIVLWDPKTYPGVSTIKQLGQQIGAKGGVVRYFDGAAYMAYLTGSGILPSSVADGSYDGTPSKFVIDQGKSANQGFATAEPYIYSHEVQAWDKPVQFQLVADTGWDPYPEPMSVRTGDLKQLTPCLKKLVPVMQQADVDYMKDPSSTNALIIQLVQAYNNGWTYDENVANYAVDEMKKLHLVTDAGNSYVGAMSASRIADLMKIAVPIFQKTKGSGVKAGLTPTDLFTNQFLSHSIGLGY